MQGLAPYVGAHASRARWWAARARWRDGDLVVERLDEKSKTPAVDGVCGLAAPCSLPAAFVSFLGLAGDRAAVLAALGRMTAARLRQRARAFATSRPPGQRHPLRCPAESRSALERDRLTLFHASLPLLRRVPARPWGAARPPFLFEVDSCALRAALGLPEGALGGADAAAIAARVRVLSGLAEGAFGFRVDVGPRDYAVASVHALDAVLAVAAAAWLERSAPDAPANAEAWLPLPA